jgi:hypothetical protein
MSAYLGLREGKSILKGIAEFLEKPVDHEILLATAKYLLEER